MPDQTTRYAEPASLLGSRSAVVVTDDGLLEELRLGTTRITPWSRVRGTRWLAHDRAVVDLDDGTSLSLPEGIDELADLVAEIEQRAQVRQQAWRQGVPPERIREWLGIEPGAQWVASESADDQARSSLVGAISVCVALLIAGAPPLVLVVALALLIAMLLVASRRVDFRVSADEQGVTYRQRATQWHMDWSEVQHIDSSFDFVTLIQTIRVRCGDMERRLSLPQGCRLATTLEQVAKAHRAGFLGAGLRPVPPTALSLTRLGEPTEADRGLSQTGAARDGD